MLGFIIYIFGFCFTFWLGYRVFYDTKSTYTEDSEFLFFWLCAAFLWPIFLPLLAVWEFAKIFRPSSPNEKLAVRQARVEEGERKLLARQVALADLEHGEGYIPADPPEGWVPVGHRMRYYLDRKLSR